MTHAVLLAVACGALAVALIGVGLAIYAIRSTFPARTLAHRHERRTRDQGPPGPERRHRAPEDARARRRDEDDPQWRVDDPASYPPRPIPRPVDDDPSTVEHALPTADMRTLPPPGSIPR